MNKLLFTSVLMAFVSLIIFTNCSNNNNTSEQSSKDNDKIDTSNIEKPEKKHLKKEHGGIVISETNDNGFVVAEQDLGVYSFYQAETALENLELNGYKDWRMPTIEELKIIYSYKDEIGGFSTTGVSTDNNYYSSTETSMMTWAVLNFRTGQVFDFSNMYLHIRPVRSF